MAEARPLLTELHFAVRSYDTDFLGIVNNIVYVRWLSDLRHALLDTTISLADLQALGLAPALTRTEVNYRRPIRLGDQPLGRMWVSRLRRSSWTVSAEFVCAGEVSALATQEGCFVDLDSLRPARVPPAMQSAYQAATPLEAA